MKLGLFLLVFGLLVAAVGVYAWQYGMTAKGPELYNQGQYVEPFGLAILILGGGLALGGLVRMIVKR